MNWRRGIFRFWVALAVAWIGFFGLLEYYEKPWNSNWHTAWVRTEGPCWNKIAKWPDGQPFDEWDAYFDEDDTPENVEDNKKNHRWAAESIPERHRWADRIRQELTDCEASAPITQRAWLLIIRIWDSLKDSLTVILLPPVLLLVAGYVLAWVIRGFRAAAPRKAASKRRPRAA
jgi:hypothetical protein